MEPCRKRLLSDDIQFRIPKLDGRNTKICILSETKETLRLINKSNSPFGHRLKYENGSCVLASPYGWIIYYLTHATSESILVDIRFCCLRNSVKYNDVLKVCCWPSVVTKRSVFFDCRNNNIYYLIECKAGVNIDCSPFFPHYTWFTSSYTYITAPPTPICLFIVHQ